MGIKRDLGPNVSSKSADKKARYEAGLDFLTGGNRLTDLEDVAVDHIIGEVKAPRIVQEKLDGWIESFCSFIKEASFPKVKVTELVSLPIPVHENVKFPGANIVSCDSVGPLKLKTLVFPSATGLVVTKIRFSKTPETLAKFKAYLSCCLAQFTSLLEKCPLLDPDSLEYELPHFSNIPCISFKPSNKLGKNLKIRLLVVSDMDLSDIESTEDDQVTGINELSQFSFTFQSEIDSFVCQPPFQTASMILEIWTRQVTLVLPDNLIETIMLHCFSTNLVSTSMKPWQIVKKVWGTIASLPLTGQQLILGVVDPVPASDSCVSPLLGRDGITLLFPSFTYHQWNLFVQTAARASNLSVEESLLKSLKTFLLFDRVFEVQGETDSVRLLQNLNRGLGTRANTLAVVGGKRTWPVKGDRCLSTEVCVRFDPVSYWQPVTHGPDAGSETAKDFRNFWGDRSELRRFQDGAVKEVVVWSGDKDDIVGDVVRSIVGRHHKGCDVEEKGDWGSKLLSGDGGSESKKEFDKMVPILYGLENLPLKIAGVVALGTQARCSKVEQNIIMEVGGKTVKNDFGVAKLTGKHGMAAHLVEPLDAMLVAEHSGKWPKDSQALRRVRLAWLMEVGKQLGKKVTDIQIKIMGETLIVMTSGQVFRFCVGDKGEGENGQLGELCSWLGGVNRSFPSWSGCVRLVQRWMASNLMSSIPTPALEVSVATILASSPQAPTAPTAAFLLWLHTIATHDWNSSPLIYPGSSTNLSRDTLPPMAVICPYSPTPSHWTKSVTWPDLQRMVSLANIALSSSPSLEMFSPSLSSYEALIHLKPLQVPTRNLAIHNFIEKKETPTPCNSTVIPVLSHNPVQLFIDTLQSCYGDLANFYYDKFGGTVIAVKVKSFKESKEKVKLGDLTCKMIKNDTVAVNWGAVMEDWSILGEGLVKEVEVINPDLLL